MGVAAQKVNQNLPNLGFLTDCLALADEFAVFHSKEYW
jgi:hypothetical protein